MQTFQPDARPIVHAARHDVERFLAEELERRRELGYPPFKHLVRIVVSGPELERRHAGARGAEGRASAASSCSARRRCRGCAAATARSSSRRPASPRALASQAARLLQAASPALRKAGLTAVVDVDPQSV